MKVAGGVPRGVSSQYFRRNHLERVSKNVGASEVGR
jgi:hypothetical protein